MSQTWRNKELDDLKEFYIDTIKPQYAKNTYPNYEWLCNNGYRGFEDAISQHGLTLTQFFTEILDYTHRAQQKENAYEWNISNERTIYEFEEYLESMKNRQNYSDSTISSKRARLANYAREYESLHGMSNLIEPGANSDNEYETEETIAYRRAIQVFDELDAKLSTGRSKLMYWKEIDQFYDRLQRWSKIDYNPVSDVPYEFSWEREDADNKSLSEKQVQTLYQNANTDELQLIILCLAAWGLRPNEVAKLHADQIKTDDSYPYIEFDTRKNGPGTVSILFGDDLVMRHIDTLRAKTQWNGYLFPSTQSQSGHLTTKTIRERFKQACASNDIYINNTVGKPKQCRRFWYTKYQEVMGSIYEQLEQVAEDQGSASASVVQNRYIDEDSRRQMRRQKMKEKLRTIFTE